MRECKERCPTYVPRPISLQRSSSSCANRANYFHPASSGANIQPAPSTAIKEAKINATGPKAVIATCTPPSRDSAAFVTIIALFDDNLNRPLAPDSVVPGHLLRITDILVV